MTDKQRIHIIVSGRVQGVFFRDFTRRKAESLGLTGWVRNINQNRVEIIAEGYRQSLLTFIKEVKIGPESSRVDHCDVEWLDYKAEFKSFEILYTVL